MKTSHRILLCVVAFCLAGCLPQERFWWSPDGSRAVVAVGDQLYLTTASGELKEPLSSELKLEGDLPIRVSWQADGGGFALHRIRKLASWDEARSLLPADEVKAIERHAAGVPALLNAAVAMSGDGNVTDALWSIAPNRDKELLGAAFFCALGKNKAAVESAFQASLKGAEFWAEVGGELSALAIHEICLVKLKGDQLDGHPTVLLRSIHPVVLPELSPKFPVLAYWRVADEEKRVGLVVCTLDGKSQIDIASTTNTTFGWSPDGRSLIFAAPVSANDELLQSIRKVTVVQESGNLVDTVQSVELAMAIATDPPRLCSLPDGRVLFASQPVTLPAPGDGLNLDPRLYLISADGKSVTAVPTAPGDLPTNLGFFAASPDGKRVAVVESDTDAVAIVELATGKTDIVSPAHPNWHCRTMPAWKSATELTFAALDAPDGKPRWLLWTEGKGIRNISEKWPAEATARWLERKEQQKTP
jgi:hypothetical protein